MKTMIIGAGKLGYKLASALSTGDNQVTVVDSDSEVLEKVSEHLDVMVVKANGVQIDMLKELDIKSYNLVIAVTDSDETNMIICSLAKKLGCDKTIARVRNPEYARQKNFIAQAMGIDYIVNPELATAKEIIRYLLKSYSFYSGDFADGRILMVDFIADCLPGFVGKKIHELEDINDLLIVAISRNGEVIIPSGSSSILEKDIVYVIGKRENIEQLAKRCKSSLPTSSIRKVMILGGGKLGYYLAEKLSDQNIFVKIIEQKKERCEYLSEKLNGVLVICGDGTDPSLLDDEDISNMDAFISVTGFDEENLLMTLIAKQAGVKKVIAKISKPSYEKIIERLGVDIAISPIDITASDILKYIRGGRAVSVSLLLGGQAEVTEIIADENMPIIGKPLSQLGLPEGIIIGAIAHRGKVIIPNGSSVITPGDRFVVFCLSSEIAALEAIFKRVKGRGFGELWNRGKGAGKSARS
ncbi:MAG TPA: Trk system potassium transporter TrkA [Clostridiaceae bacterium]|nr:Trk system potassium transporter TrkA [Clostridiaceae bacterium]